MTSNAGLTWRASGRFPGMPDTGSVSADLADGGSVMIAPHPHTGRVEMVRFTPEGGYVLLLSNAGSIEAAKRVADERLS